MSKTIGQLIEDAVQQYGVRGPLFGITGDLDTRTVTVVGCIRDSDDRPALFLREDGEVDVATYILEVPMESTEPPEV